MTTESTCLTFKARLKRLGVTGVEETPPQDWHEEKKPWLHVWRHLRDDGCVYKGVRLSGGDLRAGWVDVPGLLASRVWWFTEGDIRLALGYALRRRIING